MKTTATTLLVWLLPAVAAAAPAGQAPADTNRIREALLQEVRVTDAAGFTWSGILESADDRDLRLRSAGGGAQRR